ncbi:flavodoxin domain-containing protein [Streptomyces sp. NPDC054796]
MSSHVLVAYGSKHGSTAEIAQWVADALSAHGHEVTVRPADEVRSLDGYDGVVLGSALYAGRWHRGARRFARQYRADLAVLPVWLFSSGPLDGSAAERDIPATRQVQRIAARLGAREHVTFGGRLTAEAGGRLARRVVADGKGGDFRDPQHVKRWAAGVALELNPAPGKRP